MTKFSSEICDFDSCTEIKERRLAEHRLLERERHHRDILHNLSDAIYLVEVTEDGRFRYLETNRAFEAMMGVAEDAMLGKYVGDTLLSSGEKQAAEDVVAKFRRCLESGCATDEEITLELNAGRRILNSRFTPLFDEWGRIDRILGSSRDITENRQTQQLNDFLAFVLNQANDAVFLIDPNADFRFVYVNDQACQSVGYSRDELLSMTVAEIDPCVDHLPPRTVAAQFGKQTSMRFETSHRRKDGRIFPVEISSTEFTYADKTMVLAIVRDISERKTADEALRQKEERHRRFFEHELVGMAITSTEKGWLEVNDKLCAMLGYTREELLNLTWSELTHPEDLQPDLEQFEQMLKGETDAYTLEKRYIRKDGSIIYANLSIACVRRPDGSVDYVQVLIEDISERKRAIEQLKASQRMLAEAQEIAQLGSWDWDVLRDRVAWSEMAFEIYTPDQRPQDPGYREFLQSLHIDDKERVMAAVQSAFDHGTPFDIEHRVVSESKGVRTVHARGKVFRGANGLPVRMVGTVQDITDYKRVESDKKMLIDILQASPDFVGVCDMSGRLGYHNPAARLMAGFSVDADLSDRHFSDMHPEWTANLITKTAIPTVFEQGVWRGETALLHRDGREISVLQTIMLHRDANGTPMSTSTIMQDITERKRMEAERQRHLHFFESMDKVNRALQSSTDLETAMNQVLETLLAIFACDRAYLVYPCDPDADLWTAPFERTNPEYPGIHASNTAMPMTSDTAKSFREMLNTNGPLTYGNGNQIPISGEVAGRFRIRSFIASALHPKGDKPWQFGLHQCSGDRTWTAEEQQLFQEIGRRITDSLSNLLAFREAQDREQKFRILADSIPDSICRYDLQLRKIDANLKLRQILAAEFGNSWLGKTPKELYLDGSMDEHQARLEQVIKTGACEDWESSRQDLQHNTRYFQTRYAALRDYDGKIIGALAIFTYITQQRQLEQALIRNERELRLLLSNTPGYIARFDLELRSTFVSKAYGDTAKTTLAEVIGKTPLDYWRLASPTAEEFCEILRLIIATRQPDRLECNAITAAGTRRYFSLDLAPEFDENGNVTAVLAVGVETTEFKLAEQRRVEAREDERKVIARELHDDLGQRLTALRLDMQLMELKFGNSNPELCNKIKETDAAIGDTIAIVRNLLTMLRPFVLELGLAPALGWLVGDFRKKTFIDCRLTFPQTNTELTSEQSTAIFRIVQESLNNIAKHAEARKVDVTFLQDGSGYRLEICDDGKGFDLETCMKKTGSFGIQGIQERVHLLGGKLLIASSQGQGTKLTVLIPDNP